MAIIAAAGWSVKIREWSVGLVVSPFLGHQAQRMIGKVGFPAVIRILTAMICSAQFSLATDYYVNTSGSDSNPGTQTLPWQTINRVNSATFAPGDRIFFAGGQTFTGPLVFNSSSAGTVTDPIVVGAYGTGTPTISSTGDGILITDTQGFLINNLKINGGSHLTNTGRGIYLCNDVPGNVRFGPVTINNVTVLNFGKEGIAFFGLSGSSGWDSITITNSSITNSLDGIQSWSPSSGAHTNILIDGVTAYSNPGKSGSGGGSGIVLGQVDGATIQRCIVYGNGASNTLSTGPVGIWCYNSNNVTIQYNESYNNSCGSGRDGDGFDLDINTTNSVLQYNFSHGNAGAGYLFGGLGNIGGNTIRYNVSQNDGIKNGYAGIVGWGQIHNVEVYNNWVFAEAPAAAGVAIFGGATITNLTFEDNVIFVTGNLPIINVASPSGVLFSGNDYWRLNGSFLITWGGARYTSLADWETATGQEIGTGSNASPPALLAMPVLSQ